MARPHAAPAPPSSPSCAFSMVMVMSGSRDTRVGESRRVLRQSAECMPRCQRPLQTPAPRGWW